MSTLKVDTILKRTGTGTITVGQSGDTISVPSGATLSVAGSASGLPDNTPAFEAFLSSDMNSLSNNTFTKITFDTESFDSDGTYDTSNNRFTPGVAGKYYVYGRVIFNDTNVSEETYHISIRKNGSQISEFFTKSSAESSTGHDDPMLTYVEVVDLDADDYVEIFGKIANSNGSRGIHGSSATNKFTTFGAFKVIGA